MAITAEIAKEYLELNWPVKAKKCYELPTKFVFDTYPKGKSPDRIYLDSLVGVSKNDGTIARIYPPTEPGLENAKEVPV